MKGNSSCGLTFQLSAIGFASFLLTSYFFKTHLTIASCPCRANMLSLVLKTSVENCSCAESSLCLLISVGGG